MKKQNTYLSKEIMISDHRTTKTMLNGWTPWYRIERYQVVITLCDTKILLGKLELEKLTITSNFK